MPKLEQYGPIDEAFAIFAQTAPTFGFGLSNHGPMAAEALCAMGQAHAVPPWVKRYRKRLEPRPSASSRISRDHWLDALGHESRVGDWIVFFENELKEAPWREVLRIWSGRLARGISSELFHAAIRTGHAARALANSEAPARLDELAAGLGYWAASYSELPKSVAGPHNALPSQAIKEVDLLPQSARTRGKLLTDSIAALADFPPFAATLERVDTSGDLSRFLSDLTETFAQVYVANVSGILLSIAFVHGVTGPAAVRLMAPYIDDGAARELARYAWQTSAALYSAFGKRPRLEGEIEPPRVTSEELIARAVENGDEHAIKFTEACLREYALNPKPVYLAAAKNAIEILPPLE